MGLLITIWIVGFVVYYKVLVQQRLAIRAEISGAGPDG